MQAQRIMRPQLALLLALFVSACSSTAVEEQERLPLFAAILPIDSPLISQVSEGELPGEDTDLRLALTGIEVTEAAASALAEQSFTGAQIMRLEAGEDLDSFTRNELLLQQALDSQADLIVQLELRYDPEIYRRATSTFWLNYPLFLFAGPTNWLIDDHVYYADAELTATVYDRHALEAARDQRLGDVSSELLSVTASFAEAQLNFFDRSTDWGDYALGVFVPSGHLARATEETHRHVHEAVVAGLREELVRQLFNRRAELVRGAETAPVHMQPEEVALVREGDQLVVRGSARLDNEGWAERLRAVHLQAGSQRVSLEPTEARVDGRETVYAFEARLPLDAEAQHLRIECDAGSRDRFVRSYTYAIPGASDS